MITRQIDVTITPEEAAEAFAGWDAKDQAAFFSEVYDISRAWPGAGWCQQSYSIVRELDASGKNAVESLADHFASAHDWRPSEADQ